MDIVACACHILCCKGGHVRLPGRETGIEQLRPAWRLLSAMRVLGKYTHMEKLGKYATFGVSTPYARKAHSARALKLQLQILHLARQLLFTRAKL